MTDTTTDRPAQSGFDWQALEPDVRRHVQDATEHLHTLERRTSESIIEIGQTLIDVKARLGHGEFLPWLDAEFGWSWKTANRFMTVADAFKLDNLSNIEQFAPSALYALASGNVPEDVREGFIAKAEAGQRVTHKAVRMAIAEHEPSVTTVRFKYVDRPEPEPTVVRVIRPASTDDPADDGVDAVREVGPYRAGRRLTLLPSAPEPPLTVDPEHEEAFDDFLASTPEERQRVVDALAALFAALHREDGRGVDVHEVDEHLASASREDVLRRFFGGDPARVTLAINDVLSLTRVVCERVKPTS